MKISIITVTYNCAETIERTIVSVLEQTYDDYEYIIIDGASNDGTTQLIEKYRSRLAYYVSEPDSGIYAAMNKGLKEASGDLVMFLNGDDYFADKDVLSNVALEYVDTNTIIIGRVRCGHKITDNMNGKDIKSKYYGITYHHQGTFAPKYIYNKIGVFDENYRYAADFEWICRALFNNFSVKWIDTIITIFTLGGVCSTYKFMIETYLVSDKYMNLTNDPFIDDMRNNTRELALGFFFKEMCMNEKYAPSFEDYFKSLGLYIGDTVQIWGAGVWPEYFISAFSRFGIRVNYIFDSNSDIKSAYGIEVMKFDKTKVTKLFISTENYDYEISNNLKEYGFVKNQDFIEFHSFRDAMLRSFDKQSKIYLDFTEQMGEII